MVAKRSEADLPLFGEGSVSKRRINDARVNDPGKALKLLAVEARGCTRCDLYKFATQTVFGEGPAGAHLMLVGEQPGDQEDLQGHPFVGPAGKVLDRALEAAGLDRAEIYVTNAVKHFKNEPRGKRRLHKKPNAGEIDACEWWLDHELRYVAPNVVVALGATALRALTHKPMSIASSRGRLIELPGARLGMVATVHPSYLLRIREDRDKRREFDLLVKDLRLAAEAAQSVLK